MSAVTTAPSLLHNKTGSFSLNEIMRVAFKTWLPILRTAIFSLLFQVLSMVLTYFDITRWLVGNVLEQRAIRHINKFIFLSHPLYTLIETLSLSAITFNSLPDLLMCFVFAVLHCMGRARGSANSNLVGCLYDVLNATNGMLGILHSKKSGQVSRVRGNPYENAKPVASCQNTT